MAISLIFGRDEPTESKDQCYQAIRTFLKGFTDVFGSTNCQVLTGVHLGTPDGQKAFREKGRMKECTEYVGEATRQVIEITRDLDHSIEI